jgi:hypothetical protein
MYIIKMSYKYSIFNMLNEYKKNKHLIDAYIKNQPIEGLNDDGLIMGISVGLFSLLFVVSIILFIWALWATIKFWSRLNDVAKVILVISWLVGPPILPLIVVYVGKK